MNDFQKSFTEEQKAIIISTMIIISDADGGMNTGTFQEKKAFGITATLLGISVADPLVTKTIFYKLDQRIEILNTLNIKNKEWLATALDDLLRSAPKLSITKIQYAYGIMDSIGISETRFNEIVDKARAIAKRLS